MTFCLIDDSPGDIEPEWGVSVKMKTANVAPVMDPVADRTVAEATTLTFNVHGSDLDDDTITYAASPLPAGASLDPITGVFSWTPTFTQEGTYDVTFTASDGVASGSKPARLTVSHTNAPPVLAPIGNQTAYKGTVFCLHLSVTDPDGGPISYQVSALPPGATFDYTTGYLGWLLSGTATYASSYTLTLTAQDAQGLTDSETIVIYVRTLSCLLGGTEILLADGTSKPIEQVRPGDMVASLDETTGVRAQARVTQVMPGTSAMHLVINGSLRVTDRHPFLVAGQWLAAGEIMVGDALLRADGTMEPVRCIDVVEGEETVYDLTVEPTHTFFADGVLVHNKTPVGSGCQDPPDPTHPPRDL
jgi:PKD repeat protein